MKGFTEKYNVNKLVYFEETRDVTAAIGREKEIEGFEQGIVRFLPTVEMTREGLRTTISNAQKEIKACT